MTRCFYVRTSSAGSSGKPKDDISCNRHCERSVAIGWDITSSFYFSQWREDGDCSLRSSFQDRLRRPLTACATKPRYLGFFIRHFPYKKTPFRVFLLAGRWGFEPQIGTSPITDFESAAFDHSAIFPYLRLSICYPSC